MTTDLFEAIKEGDEYKLKHCIDNQHDLNGTQNGLTPLHLAVKINRLDMISILLANKVKINIADCNGNTPVHIAVLENRFEATKLLIERSEWDINAKNNQGHTLLELIQIKSNRFTKWKEILEMYDKIIVGRLKNISTEDMTNLDQNKHSNRKRRISDDEDGEGKRSKHQTNTDDSTYASSGLKTSLHGTIYQLQLLMLFVHRALKHSYFDFHLATELDMAEKFDDVVIKYKKSPDDTSWTWRFLQAKHKEDTERHKITVNDLSSPLDKGADFSIQKYFLSFSKMISNPKFKDDKFEEFNLCTNTDFDFAEHNKRKRDGNFMVHAQKHNENVNKWKHYFIKIDINEDEILKFQNHDGIIKCKFKTEAEDDLLHIIKKIFLEKVLQSNVYNHFKFITSYLETIKCLETKALIKQKLDIVYDKLNESNKLTKKLLEPLSKEIVKLKGTILQNDRYKVLEEFISKDNDTKKPTLQKVENEIKIILKEIDVALKEENQKLSEYFSNDSELGKQFNADCEMLNLQHDKIKDCLENLPKLTNTNEFLDEINRGDLKDLFSKSFLQKLKQPNSNADETKVMLEDKLLRFTINTTPLFLLMDEEKFKTHIKEFVEKFSFVVKYVNVDELNKYLREELGDKFKLLNADLITNSFQKEILDWLKKYNKGRSQYLTEDKGDHFFKSINQKICTLMTSGLNKAYPQKLKEYDINFKSTVPAVNDFLQSRDNVLHLYTNSTRLAAIQVLNILEDSDKYKAQDSFIFLRIQTILRKEIQKLLMESFNSKQSHHLLVVECFIKSNNDFQTLFNKFKYILQSSAQKKIIFISNRKDLLDDTFGNQPQPLSIDFEQLDKESQSKVLEKKCHFQNKEIHLKALMNDKTAQRIFDEKVLTNIIEDKPLHIGNDEAFYFNDYIQEYYIERNLQQQKLLPTIFKDSDKCLFFVTGADDQELRQFGAINDFMYKYDINKKYDTGIVWYLYEKNEKKEQGIFQKLCNEFGKGGVHWLDCYNSNIYWKRSNGDFERMFKHIDKEYVCTTNIFNENYFSNLTNFHQKIIIIANDTGVGKSTFLTGLSRKMVHYCNSVWTIRINLNDFAFNKDKLLDNDSRHKMKSLKEITFRENDIACAIEYFIEMVTLDHFQKRLLKFSLDIIDNDYQTPQIVILFDGFDEICPTYSTNTINLIKSLGQTNVAQIYVTTRLHEKEMLEKALQTPAYLLKPFENHDQVRFLSQYWKFSLKFLKENDNMRLFTKISDFLNEIKSALDEDEIEKIISNISIDPLPTNETLRSYINNINFVEFAEHLLWKWKEKILDEDTTFNIVPLHLRMLAEIIVYEKFKIDEDFKLLNLYDKFVELKYNIFYDDKKNLGNTVGSEEIRDRDSSVLRGKFRKIARQVLFSDIYIDEFEETEKVQLARIGLLIIKGSRLDFIHRSFAGFFLSESTILQFSEEQTQTLLFETILYEDTYNFIREFFNSQLETNSLQDVNLSENSAKLIKIQYGTDTILHINVFEGYTRIVQFIIRKVSIYPDILQELLMITGKYGGVLSEIIHNPIRKSIPNPKMLQIIFNELQTSYDILEKVITRSEETHGLIFIGTQTAFTLLEKSITCRNVDVFQTCVDSVKNNPESLKKVLLTNGEGLLNLASKCGFQTSIPFPQILTILYETIEDRLLFQELLLERNKNKYTILHLLVDKDTKNLLKDLLNWLIQVKTKYDGIVENLIKAGAIQNLTPLEIAVYKQRSTAIVLMEFLKDHFNSIFEDLISVDWQENILFKSIAQGKDDSTKSLLQWFRNNVDSLSLKNVFLITTPDQRTCLHLASGRNCVETIEIVLNFLKEVNNTPPFENIFNEMLLKVFVQGRTILTEALNWKHPNVVKLIIKFLKSSQDQQLLEELIGIRDASGKTCIHISAASGNSSCLQSLLDFIQDTCDKDLLIELILSGDSNENSALHENNSFLLDFIYQHMDLRTFKKMILKANNGGTTLLDIMFSNTNKTVPNNVRDKIESIINELSCQTEVNITFTNSELRTIKKYVDQHSDRADKEIILKIIENQLGESLHQDVTPNNDVNQNSTGLVKLLLP